jgi:4-hydroxybenzoate polyprenyltransferase
MRHEDVAAEPDAGRRRLAVLRGLALACHPAPCVAVTAIATTLAARVGRGAETVLVAAAVLSGQLAVGWSNDVIDRHRDLAARRLGKPIVAGLVDADTVRRSAIVALAACVPLSLATGLGAGSVHLAAVACALAYNLVLKQTIWSALPYAAAFAVLPAFATLGLPEPRWPAWWATLTGALLGAGAHFVNALDDLDLDRRTGVLGLPQRVGAGRSLVVGVGLHAGAIGLLVGGPAGRPSPITWLAAALALGTVAAVVLLARRGRREDAWRMSLVTAAVAVLLLVASGRSL